MHKSVLHESQAGHMKLNFFLLEWILKSRIPQHFSRESDSLHSNDYTRATRLDVVKNNASST